MIDATYTDDDGQTHEPEDVSQALVPFMAPLDEDIIIEAEFVLGEAKRYQEPKPDPQRVTELERKVEKLHRLMERLARHDALLNDNARHCVSGTLHEYRRWGALKLDEPQLGDQDKEGLELFKTWRELSEDVFCLLRRNQPVLYDLDQINPRYWGNRLLEQIVTSDFGFERLHDITRGNEPMALIAAIRVQSTLLEMLRHGKGGGGGTITEGLGDAAQEASGAAEAHAQSASAAKEAIEALEQAMEAGADEQALDEMIARAEEALEQADQDLEERKTEMQQSMQQAVHEAPMQVALQQALEQAREAEEAFRSWGVGQNELSQRSAEEVLALYRMLVKTKSLKNIADLLGRQRIAITNRSTRFVPIHGNEERVDLRHGRDIHRMPPSEFVAMRFARHDFASRMADGRLLNYKSQARQIAIRGDGVALIDLSGSTYYGSPYTYEEIERATVISILEYFQAEGRGLYVILFDDGVRATNYAPPNMGFDELMELKMWIATSSYGGGTNFFEPIEAAFKAIATKEYLEDSNIVMLTDGQCHMTEEQIEHIKGQQLAMQLGFQTILMPGGRAGVLAQLGPITRVNATLEEAVNIALGAVEAMDKNFTAPKGTADENEEAGW